MFCKNCGAENRNDSKFCLQCGAKLEDYTKPKQNLLMPKDVKDKNVVNNLKLVVKILYFIAIFFLLASGIFVFCSLFFSTIPLIVTSMVCLVITFGLGVANLVINHKIKTIQNPKINKSKAETKSSEKSSEKLPTQSLPPQDDQINYKR